MLTVTGLTCETLTNPLGLDTPRPRLAWQLSADRRGVRQSAYQLTATSDGAALWDTGRVASAQSTQVEYAGPALAARQRVSWQVRVWDEAGAG